MNFVLPDCIYDWLNCFFPILYPAGFFIHAPASIFAWARKNKTTMDFPKYGSDYAQIFALFFCENMYNPLNVMSPLSINNS